MNVNYYKFSQGFPLKSTAKMRQPEIKSQWKWENLFVISEVAADSKGKKKNKPSDSNSNFAGIQNVTVFVFIVIKLFFGICFIKKCKEFLHKIHKNVFPRKVWVLAIDIQTTSTKNINLNVDLCHLS